MRSTLWPFAGLFVLLLLILLLTSIFVLPGCFNEALVRQAQDDAAIAQQAKIRAEAEAKVRKELADEAAKRDSSTKTQAIAQHVSDAQPPTASAAQKGAPDEAKAIQGSLTGILQAAGIDPALLPQPRVLLAQWLANSRTALADVEASQAVLKEKVASAEAAKFAAQESARIAQEERDRAAAIAAAAEEKVKKLEEENSGVWAWLKGSGALVGILGVAGIVGRALNIPGVSMLVDLAQQTLLKRSTDKYTNRIQTLQEQASTALAAVTASDVGGQALALLDNKLAGNPQAKEIIAAALHGITGQPIDSVRDYFKTVARAHATDAGVQPEVDQLLSNVRQVQPTTGGQYDALAAILDRLVASGPNSPRA
jgi:hypothetical protein